MTSLFIFVRGLKFKVNEVSLIFTTFRGIVDFLRPSNFLQL